MNNKILSYIHSIFAVVIAFFAPIHQLMFLTGVLLVIDFITGIWAAKKRGEPITSKAMKRSVNKFLAYQLLLITAFIIQDYFTVNLGIPFVKLCSSLLGLTELKSIAENLKFITGLDILKVLVGKVKDAIKEKTSE